MPKTLLAVDDSVTMRKVIEMTFAGEDVRVVTVSNPQDALASIRQSSPDAVLADVALDNGASGYDLCKSIKDQFRGLPVILLASKQNPYDAARGQAAGADAQIDKPWDTTKAIDLVKKVFAQGPAVAAAAPAPAPAAAAPVAPAAPAAAPKPMFTPAPVVPVAPAIAMPPRDAPAGTMHGMPAVGRAAPPARPMPYTPPAPPVAPAPPDRPAAPALQKSITVDVTAPRVPSAPPAPTPAPMAPVAPAAAPPVAAAPTAPPAAPQVQHGTLAELAQHPPTPHTAAVPALGPELERKLEGLGLTPAQVDAVVALSREVVEKVVWEVVPVLAETLIKEEIARLTKE